MEVEKLNLQKDVAKKPVVQAKTTKEQARNS